MGIAVVLRACADVVMMGSVYGQDCSAGGDSGKRHGSHCQRQEPATSLWFRLSVENNCMGSGSMD